MYRITITAGTQYAGDGRILDPDERDTAIGVIRQSLAHTFGGFTEENTFGGWVKSGDTVTEIGKRWIVLSPTTGAAHHIAQSVAQELQQEAVALEIEPLDTAEIVSA